MLSLCRLPKQNLIWHFCLVFLMFTQCFFQTRSAISTFVSSAVQVHIFQFVISFGDSESQNTPRHVCYLLLTPQMPLEVFFPRNSFGVSVCFLNYSHEIHILGKFVVYATFNIICLPNLYLMCFFNIFFCSWH